MDVGTFCAQSHVLVVAGKGGVGKTTMIAALAQMAAGAGHSVLVVELEGKRASPPPSAATGTSATTVRSSTPPGRSSARRTRTTRGRHPGAPSRPALTPDDALLEYLEDHGLKRVSKRLALLGDPRRRGDGHPRASGTSWCSARSSSSSGSGAADLILVDAPATGHAITFLSSASGLLDAARGGPLRAQARTSSTCCRDPARCQVALVTLPEEMPVNEIDRGRLHPRGQGGRPAGPGHRQRLLTPTPVGLERPAAERRRGRASASTAATWPARSRRPGPSAWPATPLQERADRAPGRRAAPAPAPRARSLFADAIGPAETRARWPCPRPSRDRALVPDPARRDGMTGPAPASGDRSGRRRPGRATLRRASPATGRSWSAAARAASARRPSSAAFALAGGPARPAGLRRHHRPGPAAGRRARAWTSLPNTPDPDRGRLARRAARARCSTPRAPSTTSSQRYVATPRAGRGHPGQPALPEPRRRALGHPGVHGHGEALRAGRGRASSTSWSSTRRRRATPSTSSTRRGRLTRFLENRLFQALLMPTRAVAAGGGRGHPGAAAHHLQGGRGRDRAGRGRPSSRPSRAWRRDSAAGPARCASSSADPATAFVLVTSARPDAVDEARLLRRQAGRVATWPSPRWSSTGSQPSFATDAELAALTAVDGEAAGRRPRRWSTTWPGYTLAADREEQAFAGLVAQVAPAPVGRIPLLGHRRARPRSACERRRPTSSSA